MRFLSHYWLLLRFVAIIIGVIVVTVAAVVRAFVMFLTSLLGVKTLAVAKVVVVAFLMLWLPSFLFCFSRET